MTFMKKKLVIIKLGGSVITYKKSNQKKISRKNLDRLSEEIASAQRKDGFKLIVIHGAGSFGHIIAKKFKLREGFRNKAQIGAVADLKHDLEKLNLAVTGSLKNNSLNVLPLHPSSLWKLEEGALKSIDIRVIENCLHFGFSPVLYGDILTDGKKGFGIISGDSIVFHLAKILKPYRIVIGTDVDGLFDRDPQLHPNARLLRVASSSDVKDLSIKGSSAIDITGGMRGKMNELLKLAELDLESHIINISKPGVLKKTLLGQGSFGTIIKKYKLCE